MQQQILEKRSKTLKLSDQTYEQVDHYFDFIKEEFMKKIDIEKDNACRLVEKLIYKLDENSEEISRTIGFF